MDQDSTFQIADEQASETLKEFSTSLDLETLVPVAWAVSRDRAAQRNRLHGRSTEDTKSLWMSEVSFFWKEFRLLEGREFWGNRSCGFFG